MCQHWGCPRRAARGCRGWCNQVYCEGHLGSCGACLRGPYCGDCRPSTNHTCVPHRPSPVPNKAPPPPRTVAAAIYTTSTAVATAPAPLRCSGTHPHEHLEGGATAKASENYTAQFGSVLANAIMSRRCGEVGLPSWSPLTHPAPSPFGGTAPRRRRGRSAASKPAGRRPAAQRLGATMGKSRSAEEPSAGAGAPRGSPGRPPARST